MQLVFIRQLLNKKCFILLRFGFHHFIEIITMLLFIQCILLVAIPTEDNYIQNFTFDIYYMEYIKFTVNTIDNKNYSRYSLNLIGTFQHLDISIKGKPLSRHSGQQADRPQFMCIPASLLMLILCSQFSPLLLYNCLLRIMSDVLCSTGIINRILYRLIMHTVSQIYQQKQFTSCKVC